MAKQKIIMKKLVLALSSGLLVITLTVTAVFQAAALTIYVEDFGYTINADKNEAVIVDYIGDENEVIIPEYLYDYRITEIKRSAFDNPDNVTLCFYSESDVYNSARDLQFNCVILQPGDVNFDGTINIRDVMEIQRFVSEFTQFSKPRRLMSELNGDGIISIGDATFLQEYLADMHPLN